MCAPAAHTVFYIRSDYRLLKRREHSAGKCTHSGAWRWAAAQLFHAIARTVGHCISSSDAHAESNAECDRNAVQCRKRTHQRA
jgi:hypothetical protein